MAREREVQEILARCVSTMVFYHNCERSRAADDQMAAEIRQIAGIVDEWGFGMSEVDARIIRPVEDELIARYGHEVGPRFAARFVSIFENPSPSTLPPSRLKSTTAQSRRA